MLRTRNEQLIAAVYVGVALGVGYCTWRDARRRESERAWKVQSLAVDVANLEVEVSYLRRRLGRDDVEPPPASPLAVVV